MPLKHKNTVTVGQDMVAGYYIKFPVMHDKNVIVNDVPTGYKYYQIIQLVM